MVIDECSRVKADGGKFRNAVEGIQAKHRLLITGTPIQVSNQFLVILYSPVYFCKS